MMAALLVQTVLWDDLQCSFWHSLDCRSIHVREGNAISIGVRGFRVSGETDTVYGDPGSTRHELRLPPAGLKCTHWQFPHFLRCFASIGVEQVKQHSILIADCKSFGGWERAWQSTKGVNFTEFTQRHRCGSPITGRDRLKQNIQQHPNLVTPLDFLRFLFPGAQS